MQMVRIPREILRNLAEAIYTQSRSDEELSKTLESLRQMPESTIGYEVARFVDTRRALSIPVLRAS
jgi:hypothetical protein